MNVKTFRKPALALAFLFSVCVPSFAETLPSYAPPEGSSSSAELLASDGTTEKKVKISELEALPMVEIEGRASPNEALTRFQGPLLKDVIEFVGASEATAVTLRGLDGYAMEIPREDWANWPVLVATRANGTPLTTRMRGPARIIYPVALFPELTKRAYNDRSVWLLERIEW